MQDYGYGCNQQMNYMPYMQMMNMPQQYAPMMTMPKDQLEMMYPDVYYKVYPAVAHQCDKMGVSPSMSQEPTKDQLEKMVDDIVVNVETEVEVDLEDNAENGNRQFGFSSYGFGGRRFLRDLVGILLIRELLGRRRPFYGYPGYGYPGYGYPGYGYPGYGYPGY